MAADPGRSPSKSPPSKPILVYQLLDEKLIVSFPEGASKEDILRRLTERLGEHRGLPSPEGSLKKVLAREAGISTTLDTGLSLPHARIEDAAGFTAALGLLGKGYPDEHQPDITVRAVLLFFSPNRPEHFQQHLQFLRHVATLFQPALIQQLVECRTPGEVLSALRAKES